MLFDKLFQVIFLFEFVGDQFETLEELKEVHFAILELILLLVIKCIEVSNSR
jgi:hypothetical protein